MYILKTIDDDIKLCEVYANYWTAMATTGAGRLRALFHGTNGPEFTPEEKDAECMQTAHAHISRMRELMDQKKTLLYDMAKAEDARSGLRGDPQ